MRIVKGMVAAAAIALAVTGCSTGGATQSPAGQSDEQQQHAEPPASLEAASIIDGIESTGLVCTEKDRVISGREEVIQCKGDDYIVVTATRFSSEDERDSQYDRGKEAACDSGAISTLRSATADTWILVPGDDREKDVAAFDTAMSTLGLEWSEDACA